MDKLSFLLIIQFVYTIQAQMYYPQDEPTPLELRNQEISRKISRLRRDSVEYENYVDNLIANGISKFSISIGNMLQTSTLHNLAYSPVSIAEALALILMGANGNTFNEIATVMSLNAAMNFHSKSQTVHEQLGRLYAKLNRDSNMDQKINLAAGIFVQNGYPIRTLYKEASESIYKAETLNLDFSSNGQNAQNVINAWVADRTNNKITNILSEQPPVTTRVIIASALYFNGVWEKPFFQGFTRKRKFFPNGRKTETNTFVEMMSNGGQFPYYKDTRLGCEIMGFPYKGNQTTMYVIMPTASNIQKLKQLEARLTPNDLENLVSNTKYRQSVILFPKMKLETTIDLRESLQNLGIRDLFIPGQANLGLLSPGQSGGEANNVNLGGHIRNPIAASAINSGRDLNSVLILSRTGFSVNCTQIFDPNSNISKCEEIDETTNKQVIYKKFGDKLGRRVTRETTADSLDNLRNILNRNPNDQNVENPGLFADKVLHKVYIDITETGTEAAAATSVSLSRGGDITTFRVDVPFSFFIRHEETKLILFWGSVNVPSPNFR